jgi:hypothetical protein
MRSIGKEGARNASMGAFYSAPTGADTRQESTPYPKSFLWIENVSNFGGRLMTRLDKASAPFIPPALPTSS